MWTTFNNDSTYTPRTEFVAAPAVSGAQEPQPPSSGLTQQEWNGILLTALAPYREAREALTRAIDAKVAEKERRHGRK